MTCTGNITHIVQNFINLPVNTSIPYILAPPEVQQDKGFREFLGGEICCQSFINQDLTFLQPSELHATQPKEDTILPEAITTEVPSIAPQESNSYQEQNANSSPVLSIEVLYNRNCGINRTAPIQPVEPVVGLTSMEQSRREEDPDMTLDELLGIIPCEQHIITPLQTFDGLYVHQPSQFLPLAQEAKKLKEEEEASQWSGIPIEKFLNDSFTKQLNYIQALQQIAPLHSARDHVHQDIIRILERLGKVETTLFDKLYYLAENCADCYYTKVIQTFVKIIMKCIQ